MTFVLRLDDVDLVGPSKLTGPPCPSRGSSSGKAGKSSKYRT